MAPEDSSDLRPPAEDKPEVLALIATLTARVYHLEQTVELLTNQQAEVAKLTLRASSPEAETPASEPPPLKGAVTEARQRSLEDRVGSQIFNRIGIVAILIGATWFLKLAMDNHWIGPLGRVLVGLVAGAGLVLWSERFRLRQFAAFSYSLKAIGSGVLYLSLWASFQLYHLLPSQAAFALMLLVTLWNAWMAWSQKSELLAAYAMAGGFATPLLLATGGNHQVFLFSYVLTIDLATIVLVRLQATKLHSWSRLLVGALPATIFFFTGWYSRYYTSDQMLSTSVFITLFFLAFLTLPLRLGGAEREERTREAEAISDVMIPLSNAVFGSLAFYSVLEDSGYHAALPWGALLFAAIYLGVMRLRQAAAARAVHLTLAVLFFTIAIPLKASGRWITIGWLVEGVGLLWVSARLEASEKSGAGAHRMLRMLAALALSLGFFGLLVLPFWLDLRVAPAVFNERFATELAGIAAFATAAWIAVHRMAAERSEAKAAFPGWMQLAAALTVAVNLIGLQAGVNEIKTFWATGAAHASSAGTSLQTALSISAFLMLYGAALLAVGFWKHSAFLRWQALILLGVAIVKTFLYDVRNLSEGYRVVSFLGLGVLLMAVSFAYVRRTSNSKA